VPAILRTQGGVTRLELAQTGNASVRTEAPGSVVPLVLEIAVLKGEAMEWVVEKAVELGVRELVPVLTAHTVVQIKAKGPEAFRERWQKIADQALKQCGRLERLLVQAPAPLERVISEHPASARVHRFWCDEAAGEKAAELAQQAAPAAASATELRLLIGPEGGWSEEERSWIAGSASRVRLGPLVLRAETAALYGVSLLTSALRASNLLTKKDG
jgi:16S rRNA (uracil1498-N3)-methyltransferase